MISTVLLIPADGDPHGLLSDGPCGSRPPVMHRLLDGRWSPGGGYETDALILAHDAHDGCAVSEGCDRWYRAQGWAPQPAYTVEDIRARYYLFRAAIVGRVVFFDADGREVEP